MDVPIDQKVSKVEIIKCLKFLFFLLYCSIGLNFKLLMNFEKINKIINNAIGTIPLQLISATTLKGFFILMIYISPKPISAILHFVLNLQILKHKQF